MSIRKLMGTGACMVIIGVSAGVSYGQFQRLTAQVAPSEPAQVASAHAETAPAASTDRTDFVAASVTNWTQAPASEVTQPELIKPVAQTLPEPPLAEFETHATAADAAVTPALVAPAADLADVPEIEVEAPEVQTAAIVRLPEPVAPTTEPRYQSLPVLIQPGATSRAIPTPRDMRQLRSVATTSGEPAASTVRKPNQAQTPAQAAKVAKTKRPALNAGTRAAQRVARFERIWVTGVYR